MGKKPKRVPRIGLLFWAPGQIEKVYCADLFLPVRQAAEKGLLTYSFLTPSGVWEKAPPYPLMEQVKAERFDGLISVSIWNELYLGDLYKLGVPMVTMDHRSSGSPIDSVTFGSRQAFSQIAKLLKDSGHKDILFLSIFRTDSVKHGLSGNFIEDDTSLERRLALQEAIAGTDIEMWPLLPIKSYPGIKRALTVKALKDLITNIGKAPTAITGHDIGVVRYGRDALQDLNLRVPEDVSLISVEARNPVSDPAWKPKMDCLAFSWHQMGNEGLRMLWERMSGKVTADVPPRHLELAATYLPAGTLADRPKMRLT